jgi:hypothetical protein
MAITFTEGLAGKTAQDKAQEYNTLLGQGFSDAQIKAAADATFGAQPESDWQYLTNLAKQVAVGTPAATPVFTPTATVQAPLSMQDIANTPGMGVTGIGVGGAAIPAAGALAQANNTASVRGGDADYYGGPDTSVTQTVSFTPGLAGQTEQQKASEYNRLIGQGFTDAEIKAAADATFGTQSASDWSYLTNLAGQAPQSTGAITGANTESIVVGGDAAEPTGATTGSEDIDPYVYAYEYGVANNDFSGLLSLLNQTSDPASLISKYGLTPEQINQIEFGTGFDLDQSGGFGAGKVGNDWDYNNYLDALREGDTDTALSLYKSADPLGAQRLENMYQELQQQQTVTGDSWATGNLGSKDAAAMDFALRLLENGVGSIYDLGQRTVEKVVEGYNGPEIQQDIEYFNKKTGEALPDWARVASGNNSGSKLNYRINFAEDGTPIPYTTRKSSDWMEFREGVLKPAVSLASLAFPAIAPYVAAGNAINAADKGEWGTAIVSALTAVPGFNSVLKFSPETLSTLNTAKTTAQVLNAIDKGNPIALANTLMQTDIGKELMLQDMGGGITMGDVLNTAKIAQLANTGQYAEALATAGELTNSPNLKIVASAENFRQAINSGDPFKIFSAAGQLERAVKSTDAATQTGGITNRIPDDMTEAGAAAFVQAKGAGASDADAMDAANSLTRIADANETFDGSGLESQDAAMNAAIAEGLDKFTFGGKTFTIDNSAAQIRDFENSVAAEENALTRIADANETFDGSGLESQDAAMKAAIADGKDKFTFGGKTFTIDNSAAMVADLESSVAADTATRAASDSEFGNLAGAITDATARNTVAIGSAEADNVDEAAYLAKVRDPSATSFTFDGKTYTISASQSQMSEANKTATLAEIKDLPNFNDAYARARAALGPNQTFEWNGKQYSTATAAERPDLSAPAVQAATDESAAETARLTRQNTDLVTGNAPDQSAAETTRLANLNAGLKSMEKTGFLEQIYKDLNEQFRLQGVAANEYLANNPNSPITESVSSAFEAAGELSRNLGGAVLALDNKPLADAIIKGGERLQEAGQSIGSGPQDTKNWKDTIDLIDKAEGFEKLAVMAGRVMDGTSGLARQVELELRQELPALFLGGGLLRPTLIASGLIDTADTGGAAVIDAYDDVVKKGGTHQEGLLAGRKAGAAAAATEAAIQLTLGKLADFSAGKLDNLISKGTTKIAGEGVVEGAQEAGASAAVDLALGNAIDINKALTQGVLGAAVGKGTATATSGVDAAQTDVANQTASTVGSAGATATDLGAVGSTRPGAEMTTGTDLGSIGSITPGGDAVVGGAGTLGGSSAATVSVAEAQQTMADLGLTVSNDTAVNLATQINNATAAGTSTDALTGTATGAVTAGAVAADISSNVTTQIGSGADAATVVGSTITSSLGGGADAATVINSSVTAAINAGGNASTVVGSSVAAAVTAGANTASTVGSAVTAAVNAGSNVSVAVDSAVTAAVNAGSDVNTAVGSSVTAAINSGANVTTAVESAVTAAANTGTSVDAAVASSVAAAVNTGADVNTAVTAAVDAAVNAGNNVTVASDANVTTITNATTNTTTSVNNSTGVTTTVDANTNVTTTVDAATNTTTVVDANTNITSQTTVDTNANTQTTVVADANTNTNTQTVVNSNTNTTTSTTVDTNNNTTTQTTINANTQTTVLTNPTTNTQTTVKVNVNTGEVIDVKESDIPADWTPPVIKTPEVKTPETPFIPPTAVAEEVVGKTSKAKPTKLSDEGGAGGIGGAGLPLGINVDPASLRSKVTEGAIDPLARVKAAQAELERDVMMNQMDPRFLAVIQQRMNPQQQSKQFDDDIGALARMLGGEPDVPANEGKYYSYGSEDSIDDILGGGAANYKEGGFVEPLKASGGSMALPLLAKSGGALGHYSGRENFKEGKHVAGKGDGQSDDIPAWLADGEYVLDAELVAALGNGSTKAGTELLDEFRLQVRKHKRGGSLNTIPPKSKSPLSYLKMAQKSLDKK